MEVFRNRESLASDQAAEGVAGQQLVL
jgi:hypothetical protein